MGNLTATISDHLPQFAIIPNIFGNISGNKSNIYENDWSKFDRENFILYYFSADWEDLLKIDELNVNNSTKIYFNKINMLLDTYAPFITNFINTKGSFILTTKDIEIYSPILWRKVNRLIITNILKEIGIILKTHGKESNPLFL